MLYFCDFYSLLRYRDWVWAILNCLNCEIHSSFLSLLIHNCTLIFLNKIVRATWEWISWHNSSCAFSIIIRNFKNKTTCWWFTLILEKLRSSLRNKTFPYFIFMQIYMILCDFQRILNLWSCFLRAIDSNNQYTTSSTLGFVNIISFDLNIRIDIIITISWWECSWAFSNNPWISLRLSYNIRIELLCTFLIIKYNINLSILVKNFIEESSKCCFTIAKSPRNIGNPISQCNSIIIILNRIIHFNLIIL
jgi:hypothetical protein